MAARAKPKIEIRMKRAYAAPAASDGRRILVDRLWPRGLTKQKARIDPSELAALLEAAFRARAKKRRVAELDAQVSAR